LDPAEADDAKKAKMSQGIHAAIAHELRRAGYTVFRVQGHRASTACCRPGCKGACGPFTHVKDGRLVTSIVQCDACNVVHDFDANVARNIHTIATAAAQLGRELRLPSPAGH
jgi:transposase